jgi:hypothetical protein
VTHRRLRPSRAFAAARDRLALLEDRLEHWAARLRSDATQVERHAYHPMQLSSAEIHCIRCLSIAEM